jgi:hypothetical protein
LTDFSNDSTTRIKVVLHELSNEQATFAKASVAGKKKQIDKEQTAPQGWPAMIAPPQSSDKVQAA